jgi:short-subunit dehydrogenase
MSQLNTNLFGPMNLTKAILPYYRQRKEGMIVFIGSVNGFQGATACSPYAASKFALEGPTIHNLHRACY